MRTMLSKDKRHKFHYPLLVRYVETDMQGHVYFGHYLTYFDEALSAYLREIGLDSHQWRAHGVDFYYVEASCQYKGRAFFEDRLHIHTRVGHIGNTSFKFEFAIYKQDSDQLVATGHIVGVTVDRETEKPVRVPDWFREAVIEYEGN